LLDTLYFQVLFTHASFSLNDYVLRLSMQASSVLMRTIFKLIVMVGLTNCDWCLIHNLRVQKHWAKEFSKCFLMNEYVSTVDDK